MTHKEMAVAKTGELRDGEMRQVSAGYAAAQTLREDGFRGRVLLVTREDRAPYDRPNLSKDYLQGHAEGWDEIVYDGDPQSPDFLAYFVSGGRVLAAAGMSRDRDMAALEELMRAGRMPTPALLRDGPADFLELLSDGGDGGAHGRVAAVVTA